MFEEDFVLWFATPNYIRLMRVQGNDLEELATSINATQHMNRNEMPVGVATNFEGGWVLILYESLSEDRNNINQVFLLAQNLTSTIPELRLLDPQRLCYKSMPRSF